MFESVAFVLVMNSGCHYVPPKLVETEKVEQSRGTISITTEDATLFHAYGYTSGSAGCTVRMFRSEAEVETFLEHNKLKFDWHLLEIKGVFEELAVSQEEKPKFKPRISK